jgi:hypothetical protein
MRVGINYPWNNYGWDFGAPPVRDDGHPWGPRAAWRATIDRELAGYRSLGLFAVRWFILADGTNYGSGAARPHHGGGWHFDPPPLSPEFLEDFTFLLGRFQAAKMLLLPSLIDFHFCQSGQEVPGSAGYVKQGRADVLVDPAKRQRFLDGVLRPLVAIAAAHRDAIYAFEVMNEPEWCTESPGSLIDALNPRRTIPLSAMRAFLQKGLTIINDAGLVSTVGFNMHDTLLAWDSAGLGVTLHQFHYYAARPPLPPHTFDPRWPCIIGEFASAPQNPWPELGHAQDVYSRLHHIQALGYPAAFIWSARSTPDPAPNAVAWNDATRGDIARFVGSRTA